jgi:hypothetical protein
MDKREKREGSRGTWQDEMDKKRWVEERWKEKRVGRWKEGI